MTANPNPENIAAQFKALSDPTRVRILDFLRACCCPVAIDDETGEVRAANGPTVGEVCCHVTGNARVSSTISEHLKELRIAGLITMEKRGKYVVCGVNREALAALSLYLSAAATDSANGCGCD